MNSDRYDSPKHQTFQVNPKVVGCESLNPQRIHVWYTLPRTNSFFAPENGPKPKPQMEAGSDYLFQVDPFSGANLLLVSGGVIEVPSFTNPRKPGSQQDPPRSGRVIEVIDPWKLEVLGFLKCFLIRNLNIKIPTNWGGGGNPAR